MDEPQVSPQELAQRFAQLVMMQAQNILYLLGRLPGPHGQTVPPQLAEAKMLIDQLEMLQSKTKGNLSAQEQKLLDNSMTQMRLAFVEASGGTLPSMMPSAMGYDESPFPPEEEEPFLGDPAASAPVAEAPAPTPAAEAPKAEPEPVEEKKKYFKSYG